MCRKLVTSCIAILLILSCPLFASAQEFKPEKLGSISITLTGEESIIPISNAELSIYYVATVRLNDNGILTYSYTDRFEASGIALDDPSFSSKMDIFTQNDISPLTTSVTDANGKALFRDLPPGLYFLKQTNAVNGYSPCRPFTITLPLKTNNEYIYEIDATPKTEVSKLIPITIRKVWNIDETATMPDSISVRLYKDEQIIKTAVLSAENNWEITYNDMPQSDTYRIEEINIPKEFTATYTKNDYIFTVVNTPSLIQTGQLIWPIPLLAMLGMIFIAVGITVYRKARK